MTKIFPKTHYEIAVSFFENHLGISIEEFCRIYKISNPENHTFRNFQGFLHEQLLSLKNLTDDKIAYYSNIFFHFCMLKLYHERIYSITPAFSTKLINTNLNIDSHFLKSPFSEIFIQVDHTLFSIIDIESLKKVQVNGFYVYFFERDDGIKEIRVMAVSILEPTPGIPFNDSVFYFKIEIPSHGPIKNLVADYLKKQVIWNQYELIKYKGGLNINIIEEITYFIFNTLLYITSKDPDIVDQLPKDLTPEISRKKNKAKIRKTLQKSEKQSKLPMLIVGSKVTDQHKEIDSIIECGSIFKWKLTKRLYVEGYWRVQWYGSEKDNTKESKIIFIAPYYKGPEFSEILHRNYQIGKR